MATFKDAQQSGFGGSYSDWASSGRPEGTQAPAQPPKAEESISPARKKQMEDAQRSLQQRVHKGGISVADKTAGQINLLSQKIQKGEAAGEDVSGYKQSLTEKKQYFAGDDPAARHRRGQVGGTDDQKNILADQAREFGRQLESGQEARTGVTAGGQLFTDRRTQGIAQQDAAAGAVPTRPAPPEGGFESEEDRLRADASYQANLSNYYKDRAATGEQELATVSAQVSSFGDQMKQYQQSIDSLVNNLNASDPGLGDSIKQTLDNVAAQGGRGNLNEGTLAMIESLAKSTPPEQLQQQVNQLISNTPSAAQNINNPIDTPQSIAAPTVGGTYESLTKSGASSAQIAYQNPELKEEITPDGSILNQNTGVNLISTASGEAYKTAGGLIIPRNTSTGFPDYSSLGQNEMGKLTYDSVLGLELATTLNSNALQSYYSGTAFNQMYNQNIRETAVYADQMNNAYDAQSNRLNEGKVAAMQELEIESARQILSRDTSMQSIGQAKQKANNMMKAMVDAYGLEGSSASVAIMGSMNLKFEQESANLKKSYDINLASLANSSSQIQMGYANRLVEINKDKMNGFDSLRNQYLGRRDEIDRSVLSDKITREDNKQSAYLNYTKSKFEHQEKAKAAASSAEDDAKKDTWEREKWYSEQSGMLVTLNEEGRPVPMLDAAGNTMATWESKSFYQKMALDSMVVTTNEFGEPIMINKSTGAHTPIGNINPNNNYPYSGISQEGDFTIGFGDQQFVNGSTFDGQGECVGGARVFCEDLPYGLYTINDKRATYSGVKNFADMQPGDAITFNGGVEVTNPTTGESGKSGHEAVIESIDFKNQTVRIVDVNYNGDNKWGSRTMKFDQIDRDPNTQNLGIFRPENPVVPNITGGMTPEMETKRRFTSDQQELMGSYSMDELKKWDKNVGLGLKKAGLTREDAIAWKNEGILTGGGRDETEAMLKSAQSLLSDEAALDRMSGRFRTGLFSPETRGNINKFETLKAQMVIPLLANLKGAMSDKDLEFITNAAHSINPNSSEFQFKRDLVSIAAVARRSLDRGDRDISNYDYNGIRAWKDENEELQIDTGGKKLSALDLLDVYAYMEEPMPTENKFNETLKGIGGKSLKEKRISSQVESLRDNPFRQ